MPKPQKKTYIFIVLYVSLFSSVFVASKAIIPPLNGVTYVFLRSLIGTGFLALVLQASNELSNGIKFLKQNIKDMLILGGLLSFTIISVYFGTAYTNPSNQSLLSNLTVVFILALNFFVYKKKPEKIIVIASMISMIGILLILSPLRQNENPTIFGDVLTILSTIFSAFFTIKMESVANLGKSTHISFALALVVTILTMPLFFLLNGVTAAQNLVDFQWILLLILGIGITGAIYILSPSIFQDPAINSNMMGIIVTMVPIFGTLLGVWLYDDHMSAINIIGAILVLFSIGLINFRKEPKCVEEICA